MTTSSAQRFIPSHLSKVADKLSSAFAYVGVNSKGHHQLMTKHELAIEIADNGAWEEFHQKRGNFSMYDHHKERRLKLEKEYLARFCN